MIDEMKGYEPDPEKLATPGDNQPEAEEGAVDETPTVHAPAEYDAPAPPEAKEPEETNEE